MGVGGIEDVVALRVCAVRDPAAACPSGFTMPVAGHMLDGGAEPSAQGKRNAVLLLARRPPEAMQQVARNFADAMLEEHVPGLGSKIIGKRCVYPFFFFWPLRSTRQKLSSVVTRRDAR